MRSRNIKPGFFKNEVLGECSPLARILFAGLWCMADRDGRMEDRPKRIKVELLPYDDCDIDELLNCLQENEFIKRYSVDGKYYIAILNWSKHQSPHVKEAPSDIPPHDSTEQAPDKHQTSTEQAALIPDSLNLIPDSTDSILTDTHGGEPPQCPQAKIIELYNSILPELPTCKIFSDQYGKMLRTRWREDGERQSVEWWENFFKTEIRQSDFLMGRVNGFTADLTWIVRPKNFTKIINGNYRNKKAPTKQTPDWL